MSERTCPECGEVKPTKKFLNATRRVVSVCTDCRRKAKGRARYLKSKQTEHRADLRRERDDAVYEQQMILARDHAVEVLKEIRDLMHHPRYKLRQYLLKVEAGTASLRTEDGIKRQRQRLDYLEHLCEIIENDARRGESRPIRHYLTNTYVLNEHGYTCALNLDDADIRIHKTKEFFDGDNN